MLDVLIVSIESHNTVFQVTILPSAISCITDEMLNLLHGLMPITMTIEYDARNSSAASCCWCPLDDHVLDRVQYLYRPTITIASEWAEMKRVTAFDDC